MSSTTAQDIRDARKRSKLMTGQEAVARYVRDGDTVYTGFNLVSMELANEMIREGRRNLKAVGASVVDNVTLLTVAGCVDRIESGYLSGALNSPPFREMMADGRVRYEDYTNMTMTLRLMAGAMGMPFVAANSFMGTDYLTSDVMESPTGLSEERTRPDGT
ncbi:MAG: CoA-transferase, partial [Chloroflexota bacterium]